MRIGISAVQGAFAEHEKILDQLDIEYIELRKEEDLNTPIDGLILPGGESTVQGKLLKELNMFEPMKKKIQKGLPVLATCAGLILLAERLSNDDNSYFATMPVTVRRNAYGRQLGSFHTQADFGNLGDIPMTFIRAPYIDTARKDVEVLARVDGNIVGAAYKNQIGISFHPELDSDVRIHKMFLDKIVLSH
ncbi:MAG: pyridoxal 5'-phosphate synthase glutaminase subunit PdxT [Clostridia bacterium]|nr:pyridoxal 5'-phosphate synthase glutaminase subunit PdxT [Lachnospiraceae bacterium]NCB99751.1 pyridoxal 5'-phosphate synthase glutaminase subunit PdxT [Clostridia bacterium]NCD01678.1 pyridoxal 5'-phosphate synthase glutaminase subunit PdxT [Clostridia bacterium]